MSLTQTKTATVAENARALDINTKMLMKAARKLNTFQLMWIIVTRHKIGIMATGNLILIMNWVLPTWPRIAHGIITSVF